MFCKYISASVSFEVRDFIVVFLLYFIEFS